MSWKGLQGILLASHAHRGASAGALRAGAGLREVAPFNGRFTVLTCGHGTSFPRVGVSSPSLGAHKQF